MGLMIIDCGFIYSGCFAYLQIDYTGTAVLQPKDKKNSFSCLSCGHHEKLFEKDQYIILLMLKPCTYKGLHRNHRIMNCDPQKRVWDL